MIFWDGWAVGRADVPTTPGSEAGVWVPHAQRQMAFYVAALHGGSVPHSNVWSEGSSVNQHSVFHRSRSAVTNSTVWVRSKRTIPSDYICRVQIRLEGAD